MPYNETFEKLKAAQNPAFAEEIEAVKDNQTFFIGAYEASPEGNIPKGDFNEIFQALLNNDKALKILAEAIQARTITAGNGLQGGGSLAANRTINVVSADDSITVGADNIKVNTYDGVDGSSTTRPGSAAAVKKAYDAGKNSVQKTQQVIAGNGLQGGGALSGDVTINVVSADDGITVNSDNIKLNVVDNDTTDSGTRAASARQVKLLSEKFKNFCPFKVGDIYLTTNSTNPSSIFLGTTWQKIEGRFLLGTSGSGASKVTGGSNQKTIAQANLPNVKLNVNSFSLSTQDIKLESVTSKYVATGQQTNTTITIPDNGTSATRVYAGGGSGEPNALSFTNKQNNQSTTSATPQTSALGSGSALDITPSYYTVHMWLRLT